MIMTASFTLLSVAGIFVGAPFSALVSRQFHWIAPDGQRVAHSLLGGAMMGIGAIFAGGCNIGVGLTGVSTTSAMRFWRCR